MTRFKPHDRVTVLDLQKAGHVRIPVYIRGKTGWVVQYCGRFLNPEDLSVGNAGGPAIDLYRVAFDQHDLWPPDENLAGDQLVIEIYDHWLAPASQSKPEESKHG